MFPFCGSLTRPIIKQRVWLRLNIMLYYVILCYIMSYYVILCDIMLYFAGPLLADDKM